MSSGPTAATNALSSEANRMPLAARHDVHRLDAQWIPDQSEGTTALVVEREREHPTEARESVGSPVPPGLQDDLRVRFAC